ncbi:ubiquitin C-terminal hydrolase 12-like [Syzygium oleosum]|uniref:ubiquitin C-terminal hydrolase 12-like n=1 Tax=Syzygium oleosum TaxID=219896 RepID=UPI0024B9C86E|nr:ubiquitin C-terminal hydrolase 12-like [Syzygium oleosum]
MGARLRNKIRKNSLSSSTPLPPPKTIRAIKHHLYRSYLKHHTIPKRKRTATDSNAAEVGGDEQDEITTETREILPAHYVLKIESFSQLSRDGITMYETNEFRVGDQKWKLILYPNGDKSKKGEDHVSLYLAVSEANPLKVGWEINATVRFFVFDQIRDEYLVKEGKNRRFHAMKSKWGIPRFMPLKTFADPSNGYLVDDTCPTTTCVFGAEVYVVKSLGLGESLTLKASPESVSHE